jgi:hypothetical protein
MKLFVETCFSKRPLKRVDTIGDEERRPFLAFREKVAHRPIERSRHTDGDAVDGDNREGTVDVADRGRITAEHTATGFSRVDVMKLIQTRVEEVVKTIDRT